MNLSINEIIIYLMVLFMVLGAVDRILGNRFGLGEKFEEGIMNMGALALSMIGIICLAPCWPTCCGRWWCRCTSSWGPIRPCSWAPFWPTTWAAHPARELALTEEAGQFGGLIVGAMLGPTIVFTIPVGLGIIQKEDRPALASGVLAGVVTIPLGSLVGGLAAGFDIGMVLRNLTPSCSSPCSLPSACGRFQTAW